MKQKYCKSFLERHRKLLGVKVREWGRGAGVAEAKASAKQKEIELPVTQSSRCGFLQGECEGRVRNSPK